jgi:hypothetical protein
MFLPYFKYSWSKRRKYFCDPNYYNTIHHRNFNYIYKLNNSMILSRKLLIRQCMVYYFMLKLFCKHQNFNTLHF